MNLIDLCMMQNCFYLKFVKPEKTFVQFSANGVIFTEGPLFCCLIFLRGPKIEC